MTSFEDPENIFDAVETITLELPAQAVEKLENLQALAGHDSLEETIEACLHLYGVRRSIAETLDGSREVFECEDVNRTEDDWE